MSMFVVHGKLEVRKAYQQGTCILQNRAGIGSGNRYRTEVVKHNITRKCLGGDGFQSGLQVQSTLDKLKSL